MTIETLMAYLSQEYTVNDLRLTLDSPLATWSISASIEKGVSRNEIRHGN